jgi:trimethylamine--corrinoid protein Co-methyltransferase
MRTLLQVLSEDERSQVHERTLSILGRTGMRVDTARGRQILADAGAQVDSDTNVVRFPRALVEEALRLAPRDFALGARRPGWDLHMNGGDCVLLADGEATSVLDPETAERRPGTFDDWLGATRLIDALDEVGVYWSMVEGGEGRGTMADAVRYWRCLFGNFSKHVQDSLTSPDQVPWLIEVLQAIFGDRESIRRRHPLSFLLCPQSPLVIEGPYTDAYLALVGWDIPVAVMPMPLMGATAPGSLISTVVLGNCEVLGTLCLVQAAAPGTPFIYAPALAVMDPRSGRYSAGAIENGLLGAAATEMARTYGLPVEASGGGTDHFVPGIQAGYERSMNALLPAISWPDILVGPGLLGGSMILSLEQLMIDVEVFRMCRRAHRGIVADEAKWLDDVIGRAGPGGDFLSERSTVDGIRGGEWYVSKVGVHDTFEQWDGAGRPGLLEEARERVAHILATYEPLPLGEDVERELEHIRIRALDWDNDQRR